MNTPELGAVVELNSGGPAMVVSQYGAHGHVFCTWMNHIGVLQKELFPIACIKAHVPYKRPHIVRFGEPVRIKQPDNMDGTPFRVGQSTESWRTRRLWKLKRDLEALDDKG